MGCSESKSSVVAGSTTVAESKKPVVAAAKYTNKVEKGDAKTKQEEEGQEGDVGGVAAVLALAEKEDDAEKKPGENVKEEEKVVEDNEPEPKKRNGENAAAKNEEGLTKESEPAAAKMAHDALPEEANPPEKKEE